jgi:serine/threonine protein phosphatase 1
VSVLSYLLSVFNKAKPNAIFEAAPAPGMPLFVIGDVHGCAEELVRLMSKQPTGSQLVFVGDLIDRGPESAKVLQIVKHACDRGAVCILGNHEAMMLDFLDRPTERGGRWVRFGGLQTLASLNIGGFSERADEATLLQGRDKLSECLGDNMINWLRNLPTKWSSGNINIVHAGADPSLPIPDQEKRVLIWGHPDFTQTNRNDGQWVVFGHTIYETAFVENGRIAIDTGAYATGLLTAAHIVENNVSFISA